MLFVQSSESGVLIFSGSCLCTIDEKSSQCGSMFTEPASKHTLRFVPSNKLCDTNVQSRRSAKVRLSVCSIQNHHSKTKNAKSKRFISKKYRHENMTGPLKSFKQRLMDNVKFLENLLDNYPKPLTENEPIEEFRFKPTVKKLINVKSCENDDGQCRKEYDFDASTNQLATPRLIKMRESAKVFHELLKRFLSENPQFRKETFVPKSKLKFVKREQHRREFAKNEFDDLLKRKKRLTELILEEKKRIKAYQVRI